MGKKKKKEKTLEQLKKEKLQAEILKLKGEAIGEWIKDVRNGIMVLGFSVMTLVNWGIYFLQKTSKGKLKAKLPIDEAIHPDLDIVEEIGTSGSGIGGGGVGGYGSGGDIVMLSPDMDYSSSASGIGDFFYNMFHNPITYQVLAIGFLIPLIWDFIKKRKKKEVV